MIFKKRGYLLFLAIFISCNPEKKVVNNVVQRSGNPTHTIMGLYKTTIQVDSFNKYVKPFIDSLGGKYDTAYIIICRYPDSLLDSH